MREADRARLENLATVFAAERNWIGAGGMEMNEAVQPVVSMCAARLILNLDISYYDRLTEIVVYPNDFYNPLDDEDRCGEAHDWGVVVLSWHEVLAGLANPNDGYNPAFHEFAHVIDRDSGAFDGTPRLHRPNDHAPWADVMSRHFLALKQGDPIHLDVINDYGAKNEAEFFAVVTEAFFEQPDMLAGAFPDLHAELKKFYTRS